MMVSLLGWTKEQQSQNNILNIPDFTNPAIAARAWADQFEKNQALTLENKQQKEELVKDCEMEVEIIPGITYCEDCGETYETVKYAKVCPNCGSKHTYLIQGNEFNIKQIEVPE